MSDEKYCQIESTIWFDLRIFKISITTRLELNFFLSNVTNKFIWKIKREPTINVWFEFSRHTFSDRLLILYVPAMKWGAAKSKLPIPKTKSPIPIHLLQFDFSLIICSRSNERFFKFIIHSLWFWCFGATTEITDRY